MRTIICHNYWILITWKGWQREEMLELVKLDFITILMTIAVLIFKINWGLWKMKTRLTYYHLHLKDEFGTGGVWVGGLMGKPSTLKIYTRKGLWGRICTKHYSILSVPCYPGYFLWAAQQDCYVEIVIVVMFALLCTWADETHWVVATTELLPPQEWKKSPSPA